LPPDQLITIQRFNLVLGAVATAAAGLLWGGRGMLAAGVGAALSVANFWAIRRLGTRAVNKVASGESIPQALTWVAALVLKMTVLFGLVWLLIRKVGLPVLPFTLGLSVFVVSILITGLFLGGAGSKLAPAGADSRPVSATPTDQG
jgi:hypothetical protein